MKDTPKGGASNEVTFAVESQHTIDFAAATRPAVLSTPNLIQILERTAKRVKEKSN